MARRRLSSASALSFILVIGTAFGSPVTAINAPSRGLGPRLIVRLDASAAPSVRSLAVANGAAGLTPIAPRLGMYTITPDARELAQLALRLTSTPGVRW